MELEEIRPGILSMNGKPFDTGENLVVAVHPYYDYYHYRVSKNPWFEGYKNYPVYAEKLEEFLESRRGPIMTFEEGEFLTKTVRRYFKSGITNNRLFVETLCGDPQPKNISWDDAIDYIDELRNGLPVEIIGGYFSGERDNPRLWRGCVGDFAQRLNEKGIPIDFLDELLLP